MTDTASAARVSLPADLVTVAVRVAERLRSVERVSTAVRAPAARGGKPRGLWLDHGTACGFAGLALLFGCLDRLNPDVGWARSAHDHLSAAVEAARRAPALPLGLAAGVGGLAFVALLLADDGRRYQHLRRSLDERVAAGTADLVDRLRAKEEPSCHHLDAISGAAGILSYLVCRPERDRLSDLRDELVTLTSRCLIEGRLPRRPATGGVDCGLAHGVPGMIAALALASGRAGDTAVVRQAVRTGVDWVQAHRTADQWGPDWPQDDLSATSDGASSQNHAAWCYGAPGVARSLLLAGRVLDEQAVVDAGLAALRATCRRPDERRRLYSPTFCHGEAGLAHLLHRTGIETGDGVLLAEAERLLIRLADAFDSDSAFGYQATSEAGSIVDDPGLLDGAAGVAMVFLPVVAPSLPAWDRLFLVR